MTVRKSTYTHRRQHALKLILDDPPSGRTEPYRDDEIAGSAGISLVTVRRLRRITIEKQLMWTDTVHLGDAEWTALLNKPSHRSPRKRRPDWDVVHAQMNTPRTTIHQLWNTYLALNPSDALPYKRYAALYLRHRKMLPLCWEPSPRLADKSPTHSTAGRTLAITTRKSP